MATTTDPTTDLEAQIEEYAEKLFGTGLAAFEAVTITLGRRLGLYAALAERGPSTPGELAAAAGIDARYAREWLEQQASAGLIDVSAEPSKPDDNDSRVFALSPAATECLLRPDSLASIGPLFDFLPALGEALPAVTEAFRTGSGVPYDAYGVQDAQGDFNRPVFLNLLTSEWIPAIPGLAERLSAGPARVAEIGSGEGWAAIAIAKAWPDVMVDGFDLDEASVAAARKNAAEAGVSERVSFEVVDVTSNPATFAKGGAYDAVFAFEMIHDLAQPQAALRTMKFLGAPDAAIVVMDEKTAERFEAATENPIERLFYAASVLCCLPNGRCAEPSAATGTVMRPDTFRRYAAEAGYSSVEILPVEHDLFRFYRLVV